MKTFDSRHFRGAGAPRRPPVWIDELPLRLALVVFVLGFFLAGVFIGGLWL